MSLDRTASTAAPHSMTRPDIVVRSALAWFTWTTVIFWLPTVRGAFDGASYEWGLFGLGGTGLGGDYWFPLLSACMALVIRRGAWRGRRWAFAAIVGWSVLLVGAVVSAVASDPEGFRLRGDTLGLDLSLAWFAPIVFGAGAVVCAAALSRRWRAAAAVEAWGARNRRWLALLAAALPVQFALLRPGSPGSLQDQAGVILTIAQWLLVSRAFRPYEPPRKD
jgi:hypothetical protein